MDTTFSKEDLDFQKQVRDFIQNNYPQSLRDSINAKRKNGQDLSREDFTDWHKILGKHIKNMLIDFKKKYVIKFFKNEQFYFIYKLILI